MSSTALITSLGTAVYTYRKVSENQTQINELKERLQSTVLRLAEHQTVPATVNRVLEAIQQLNQAVTNQGREIHSIGHQLEDLTDRIGNLEEGLVSLTEDALENGMDVSNVFSVSRPKGKGKAGTRSIKKKKVTFAVDRFAPGNGDRGDRSGGGNDRFSSGNGDRNDRNNSDRSSGNDRSNVGPSYQVPLIPTHNNSNNNSNDNPLLDLTSSLPGITDTSGGGRSSRSNNNNGQRRPKSRRQQPVQESESESEEEVDDQDDSSDSDGIDNVIASVRNSRRHGSVPSR